VSRWRAAVLFDLAVAALIAVYIAAFLWAGAPASDLITPDILRIRAFGTAALILWTAWLAAAPLARLEPRLAVLGVHAGHLAVATLAAGAAHAWLVLNWYHDIGALNPLVALLADNPRFRSLTGFPYELLGVAALLLTLAVAAASHPFWRTRFGAGLAALSSTGYGLAVLHVAFGALQSERDAVYAAALVAAFAGVIALHLAAGAREGAADRWRTPLRLTRWFGVAVAAGLCVSTGTALVLAHAQRNPGPGGWGGGEVSVSGILDPLPYPVIHAGLRSDGRPASAVILVAEGKFGAPEEVRSFAGKPVEARGYAIDRGGLTVLQLAAETGAVRALTPADGQAPVPAQPVPLGRHRLRGEIVDSKCFLGAMKPGDGKAHKDCAALCVFGGIPPLLLTRDADGKETLFLLADPQGGPVTEPAFPYVGEPVEVTAEVERRGSLNLARIDPASLRPLAP